MQIPADTQRQMDTFGMGVSLCVQVVCVQVCMCSCTYTKAACITLVICKLAWGRGTFAF